jgi:hypothetical protein
LQLLLEADGWTAKGEAISRRPDSSNTPIELIHRNSMVSFLESAFWQIATTGPRQVIGFVKTNFILEQKRE